MSGRKVDESYYKLLNQLQALDFVLVELNLYLDTHPHDQNAIQQYNHYVKQRWETAHRFESQYGPLMHFGHSFSRHPWQWDDSPWPWEV